MRASTLWDKYSDLSGIQLLNRSGMLTIGSPQSAFIKGIRDSAMTYQLDTIQYSSAQLIRVFPAFNIDDSQVGIFEANAGWLNANLAIEAALKLACQFGAILRYEEPVLRWTAKQDHFEIISTDTTVLAEKLIVTAGAWASRILADLGLPLQVEHKVLAWVRPLDWRLFEPGIFPVFAFGDNFFYGFPGIDSYGVKLAVHWAPGKPESDPTAPVREATLDDAIEPLRIAASLLPQLAGPMPEALERVTKVKSCLYTNSHDGNFFLDRHPNLPNLFFAAGFSGHGFKFAPAIGEAMADMAISDSTTLPIGFLSIDRLGKR